MTGLDGATSATSLLDPAGEGLSGEPGGPRFHLPPELEAAVPPEARGMTRDAVRMLVARRKEVTVEDAHFSTLPRFLDPGDMIVVNVSETLAAEVPAHDATGRELEVHLSSLMPDGRWTIELRRQDEPWLSAEPGAISLEGGGRVELEEPFSPHPLGTRLWLARVVTPVSLLSYLAVHGRPIKYRYVAGRWPIDAYQNVWANEPGSAEMPSAGRPFTAEMVTRLVARGVAVAPVLLHTGVASVESWEHPYPEYYRVPPATARQVNATRAEGGRVIAIGTTVVRALETVVDAEGEVRPDSGWTSTIVHRQDSVRSVDGILTGWHEPEASHLEMLEAIAGRPLLELSYRAALAGGYLWHEFGDVHLVLP